MTTISKQLIINEFLLPKEIIDIIKEYAFYNIIVKTKKNKNKIISLINTTSWSPISQFNIPLSNKDWFFWLDKDNSTYQFQCHFCIKCGDYETSQTNGMNLICKCWV